MLKPFLFVSVLGLLTACGDDDTKPATNTTTTATPATGAGICEAYYKLCPRPEPDSGTYECQAEALESATNKQEVASCIDKTDACANRQACLTLPKF